MPELTIRDAVAGDLEQLVPLLDQLRESSEHPERPRSELVEAHREALRKISTSDFMCLLVAESNGRITGTCMLVFSPGLTHQGRPWCVLENMVVDGSARGSGVGAALIEEAVARAAGRDCYKMSLTSNLKRSAAHRFYEANGFANAHKGFTHYFD